MAERIFRDFEVDVPEEWESFNISVLVHCVVCHVHVPLTNCLALNVAEVFLGVVLYDLDNEKAVNGEKVSICAFPYCTSRRRRVVQIHTHAWLLRALASEDIDGCGLSNFRGSIENPPIAIIEGFNFDGHVAITHANMTDFHIQLVPR